MKRHKKLGDRTICRFAFLVLLFSFFIPFNEYVFAEESLSEDKLNKEFLRNFRDDFTGVIVSPKDWDSGDFVNLSAILGGGVLLYAIDQDIHSWFQKRRTSSSDDVFDVISPFGKGGLLVGLISTLYVSGELSHNNSLRKTALLSLESWLTSGTLALVLKVAAGRARPRAGESSHTFHPFSTRSSYTSFPSGDTTSAFAVATTIADQSDKLSIDILAYSLATLVAVGRIHDNKHWASDVFIGAALGYFVSKKISFLNRNRKLNKLRIGFQLSQEKQAFTLSFSF